MSADGLHGGDKLQAYLDGLLARVSSAQAVKVGFLEGTTYPDGTSLPMVASVQEFGGSMQIPARTQDLNFKINANTGKSRFAKAGKANFVQSVTIPAHTVTIPARPFFRSMLDQKASGWGVQAGKALKAADFNAKTALASMGELIQRELQDSIRDLQTPPNAASTVRKKGFNNPLIDHGDMLRLVNFEVKD
jgi:hypothetical protein